MNHHNHQNKSYSTAHLEWRKTLKDFWQFLIGPNKRRKPRSVKNVVGNVKQIFKIVAVNNITALFQNGMNVARKKYLNPYCVEKTT